MRKSSQLNAPIPEESHSKTLTPTPILTSTPTLTLTLVSVLVLILIPTLRMVEVTKIRNIIQKMLREHYELFANVRHSVKTPISSIQLLPI